MSSRYPVNQRHQAPSIFVERNTRQPPPALPETPGSQQGLLHRSGLLGWWLRLTAPTWPAQPLPIAERERLRKAELTSISFLALFAFLLTLLSNSLADPGTAQAVLVMAVCLVMAAFLNRKGFTRLAAYLTPLVMMLLIAAAVLQAPGGLRLVVIPAWDLFAIPIFLVSLTVSSRAPWFLALAAIAFIVADYFVLQPHAKIAVNGVPFDELAYEEKIFTAWGLINRDVALLFFAALFGWIGARSVDNAIARADKAEELAAVEHAYAEQSRQLEEGIRQIQETHVHIANGDYNARAPLNQEHILWQIAYALNNLIQRLQRSVESEHMLRRTELEVSRLKEEIQRAKAGQIPIWPKPSGTPLDPIVVEFSQVRPPGSD
jgi:hypothetical protein